MILTCEHCQAIVNAEIITSYVSGGTDDFAPQFLITFAKCPQCRSPFVASQEEGIGQSWEAPTRLYPVADSGLGLAVPDPIRHAFDEGRACIRVSAFTAAAIMCRKTLEGVCAAHSIRERNLAASLARLRDTGVIDARLFDWADQLRVFGNEAAHGVETTISAEDARDILDFTRALVEYVFTFQHRFDAFRSRRAQRAAQLTPST